VAHKLQKRQRHYHHQDKPPNSEYGERPERKGGAGKKKTHKKDGTALNSGQGAGGRCLGARVPRWGEKAPIQLYGAKGTGEEDDNGGLLYGE